MIIIATIIYLVIGFFVAVLNNFLYAAVQKKENAEQEEPMMVIAMAAWLVFWPLGLITAIRFAKMILKQKRIEV